MFDIGWSEMLVIVLVAVIVVGPRDLPGVIRTVGKWVGKARSLSREFQRNLNDIARDSGIDEVKRSIRETTSLGVASNKPSPVSSTAAGDKPGAVASAATGSGSDTEAGALEAQATAVESEKRAPADAPPPAPEPADEPTSESEGEAAAGVAGAPQATADSTSQTATQPAARAEG